MADHEVDVAVHPTLAADTVDTVTLTRDWPAVLIRARGDQDIYYRTDGADPTVGGDDCRLVPAGLWVIVGLPTRSNVRDTVKLIATDESPYTVEGVSP